MSTLWLLNHVWERNIKGSNWVRCDSLSSLWFLCCWSIYYTCTLCLDHRSTLCLDHKSTMCLDNTSTLFLINTSTLCLNNTSTLCLDTTSWLCFDATSTFDESQSPRRWWSLVITYHIFLWFGTYHPHISDFISLYMCLFHFVPSSADKREPLNILDKAFVFLRTVDAFSACHRTLLKYGKPMIQHIM